MKRLKSFVSIIAIVLFSCRTKSNLSVSSDKGQINIEWIKSLPGDFSFHKQWDYPEGVYKNEFGQLSCDGLCPDEIYTKQDSNGKIYEDSLDAFYRIVDTTHQFHSIQCEVFFYEWAGTDYISVQQKGKDTVECLTLMNSSTHCSVQFNIINDFCYPFIVLNSITPAGNKIYKCIGGFIKIDKKFWKMGILKTEFNFDFSNTEKPEQPFCWKGKIFSDIEKK